MAFQNVFKNKKIIVTGHTGFKGSWLTCWLLKMGAEVTGVSKDIPTTPSLFETLQLDKKMHDTRSDLRNFSEIQAIIEKTQPDFVFHLAAQAIVSESYKNPLDTFSSNVMGTANLLESLRTLKKPCTAILATSDKAYDNVESVWGYRETDALGGKDIYSGSKGAAELVIKSYFHSFLQKSSVSLAAVRAGNVIGGGDWAKDRIVPDAMRSWSENKAVTIRSPHSTRPWQHVLEPLSGYLRTAQMLSLDSARKINGEAYNFGPNTSMNYTVADLLNALAGNFQLSHKAFEIVEQTHFHEAKLLKLNCDKALFDLHWQPTLDYPQTVKFVSDWYFNYYRQASTGMYDFTMGQIESYMKTATQKDESKSSWAQ